MNAMQLFLSTCLSIVVLLSIGCKTLDEVAQSKEFKQPANVTLMSESDIREKLVGNTVIGESNTEPGSRYVEHFLSDGKIKGLWNDEPYSGTWAVSGSVWCSKYANSQYCSTMSLDGNQVTWIRLSGEVLPNKATILPGNAKGL